MPKILASSFSSEATGLFIDGFLNYRALQMTMPVTTKYLLPDDVQSAELLDKESYTNWTAKAGWSIGLGLATGGLGLVAGALMGGNNQDKIVRLGFADGQWIVTQLKKSQFRKLPMSLQSQMQAGKYGPPGT